MTDRNDAPRRWMPARLRQSLAWRLALVLVQVSAVPLGLTLRARIYGDLEQAAERELSSGWTAPARG